MIGAAHIPVETGWTPVGWYVVRPAESISVDLLERSEKQVVSEPGVPITRFNDRKEKAPRVGETQPTAIRATRSTPASEAAPRPERLIGRRIFDVVHEMPAIVGGMGAYYIHIEYPDEALRKGIEGRLVLAFVVETDGQTSGVEVIHPLHPACDSAAVRALRQTRFVPGRQGGDVVPVRMRIPVRFKIVERGDGLATARDT